MWNALRWRPYKRDETQMLARVRFLEVMSAALWSALSEHDRAVTKEMLQEIQSRRDRWRPTGIPAGKEQEFRELLSFRIECVLKDRLDLAIGT